MQELTAVHTLQPEVHYVVTGVAYCFPFQLAVPTPPWFLQVLSGASSQEGTGECFIRGHKVQAAPQALGLGTGEAKGRKRHRSGPQ